MSITSLMLIAELGLALFIFILLMLIIEILMPCELQWLALPIQCLFDAFFSTRWAGRSLRHPKAGRKDWTTSLP